jgi:hypothetical protein
MRASSRRRRRGGRSPQPRRPSRSVRIGSGDRGSAISSSGRAESGTAGPTSCSTEPLRKTSKLGGGRTETSGGRGRSRHDHQVQVRRQRGDEASAALPDPALDPVSRHRVADLAADGDAEPRAAPGPRRGRAKRKEHVVRARQPAPLRLDPKVLGPLAHPGPARKSLAAGGGGGHRVYFFATLTVSCLRPRRRRRRRISRPARVFIRLRKPWVRLRLLRWGWNVRFTTTSDRTARRWCLECPRVKGALNSTRPGGCQSWRRGRPHPGYRGCPPPARRLSAIPSRLSLTLSAAGRDPRRQRIDPRRDDRARPHQMGLTEHAWHKRSGNPHRSKMLQIRFEKKQFRSRL